MDFEEFEKSISERGFGIAAMNHYSISGKRHLYCLIFNTKKEIAFMTEGENSNEVFEILFDKVTNSEGQ